MPLLLLLLLALASPATTAAQSSAENPAGRWEGLVRIPGDPSALVLHLQRGEAGWRATVDIPGRGMRGTAAEEVVIRGDSVLLDLGRRVALRGVFVGGGKRLEGEARFGGGRASFAVAPSESPEASALGAELAAYPSPAPAAHPDSARIMSDDIARFWAAMDASTPETRAEVLQRVYLDAASPGLEDFLFRRLHDASSLAMAVDRFPRYYAAARAGMERAATMEPEIREAFRRLEAIHPDAVFPDVYLLVGSLSTGGTTSPRGLLIGTEVYSRPESMPTGEFEDWMENLFSPVEALPALVAHELIHYQQRVGGEPTLLRQALTEGIADWLGERIAGRHINPRQHEWADPREAQLWCEFREAMDGTRLSDWFYNARTSGERPDNLGYWMGYRIAAAYAERVDDERRLVRELLDIPDPVSFLDASGYADRFTCPPPSAAGP